MFNFIRKTVRTSSTVAGATVLAMLLMGQSQCELNNNDGDMLPNPVDECPRTANMPLQHDLDGDGYPNECDPKPRDPEVPGMDNPFENDWLEDNATPTPDAPTGTPVPGDEPTPTAEPTPEPTDGWDGWDGGPFGDTCTTAEFDEADSYIATGTLPLSHTGWVEIDCMPAGYEDGSEDQACLSQFGQGQGGLELIARSGKFCANLWPVVTLGDDLCTNDGTAPAGEWANVRLDWEKLNDGETEVMLILNGRLANSIIVEGDAIPGTPEGQEFGLVLGYKNRGSGSEFMAPARVANFAISSGGMNADYPLDSAPALGTSSGVEYTEAETCPSSR